MKLSNSGHSFIEHYLPIFHETLKGKCGSEPQGMGSLEEGIELTGQYL